MKSPDWPKWKEAIDSEYASLKRNNTWIEEELPKGRKALPCKTTFFLNN